ncbi:hypothetical protein [Cellulomonas sp. ATA003]|uniref:hypothetical protein n=1 Tax=Cellulomonas sp. ATA003 TaxID=3073064 RepID=UPI00287367CB|nr:hypothetical protein [Cellulomonas sp. ATA003]WNB84958.1 hypothetical protein REH70_14825 [Cellulomonas sp. ATA003]
MTSPDATPPDADGVQQDAARAVFRTALRDMLVLLAVLTVVGGGLGYLLAGAPGLWGALLGVALTLVFSGTTVVSMLATAGAAPQTTAAVVLGSWLGKMIVLVAALALLRGQTFYDRVALAVVLLVGVIGSALLDYRAVRGGRVPYTDPGSGSPA